MAAALPPLVLLDVDGVLNAVAADGPPTAWDVYERTTAVAAGTVWPISWAPAVVERLNRWVAEGRAEVRWLTTWEDDAATSLAPAIGLAAFEVAGGHADAAGREWWKEGVARAAGADDRALVWVDDDLALAHEARTWAESRPRTLALAPDPAQGLTPADLGRVEAFLADPDAPTAQGAPGPRRPGDPRWDVGPRRGGSASPG